MTYYLVVAVVSEAMLGINREQGCDELDKVFFALLPRSFAPIEGFCTATNTRLQMGIPFVRVEDL